MARFSEVGDCVISVVESGDLDTDEMDFQGASFGPTAFREFGDKTNEYRMQLSFTSTQGTGAGSAGDISYDLVFVASGRTGFSVYAVDVLTPFDTEELEDIVSNALAKVEDLSAGVPKHAGIMLSRRGPLPRPRRCPCPREYIRDL